MENKLEVKSKLFVDTARTLYLVRESKRELLENANQVIRQKTKEMAMFLETDYRQESQKIIMESAKEIYQMSEKVLKISGQIGDLEEALIEILELSVADCKISFNTPHKVDTLGKFFDKQTEITFSADKALEDTVVTVSELLAIQKVKELFGIKDSDVNINFEK